MPIIGEWSRQQSGPARTNGQLPAGSGMSITLPYVAVRGSQPGRILWLHGQVHRDEISGMVAALRFARSLDPSTMRGNVVVTPMGNPHALNARRKRNPYDELDIDRTYPGNADGLVSERLAHVLISEVRADTVSG